MAGEGGNEGPSRQQAVELELHLQSWTTAHAFSLTSRRPEVWRARWMSEASSCSCASRDSSMSEPWSSRRSGKTLQDCCGVVSSSVLCLGDDASPLRSSRSTSSSRSPTMRSGDSGVKELHRVRCVKDDFPRAQTREPDHCITCYDTSSAKRFGARHRSCRLRRGQTLLDQGRHLHLHWMERNPT